MNFRKKKLSRIPEKDFIEVQEVLSDINTIRKLIKIGIKPGVKIQFIDKADDQFIYTSGEEDIYIDKDIADRVCIVYQ